MLRKSDPVVRLNLMQHQQRMKVGLEPSKIFRRRDPETVQAIQKLHEQVIYLFEVQKWRYAKIAAQVGYTEDYVGVVIRAHLKALGEAMNPREARHKQVIQLYKEGHKQREIVKRTGVPLRTVGRIISKQRTEPARAPATVKQRHQQVREMHAAGMRNVDIAKLTKYHPVHVSEIIRGVQRSKWRKKNVE